jgi:hypothetical protein
LVFLQHTPEFNFCQDRLCGPERFEAQHRSNYSLDEPVVLLHDVIQVFALANRDAFVLVSVPLLSIFIRLGLPLEPIALLRKRLPAFLSRFTVRGKSIVLPRLSTAR